MVHLQWTSNSTDETGFVIQRSTDGITFADLATVGAGISQPTMTWLCSAASPTPTRWRPSTHNGTSAYAVSNSVLVPADATPPAAPSNLAASNITQTTLTLTWQDNSNNEAGFIVQRATNSSFTKNLVETTVGPDVTSFDDSGLKKNTTYYYRVLAFNGFNEGAGPFPWSPTFNVKTLK
jgi:hypothetical protein